MSKLTNVRPLGRFTNPATGQTVNIHKGRNPQRGTEHRFYLYRGKRIFISETEYHAFWERV
ncbi:hypothetical protein KASHIRA_01910 [Serratia phage vB_SmaM-Kashira]|nr:hypothetical protein KASHIRA_01910 [Serratia phage vB_SmaM-Kashira]